MLQHHCASTEEWAHTYQAALFAKMHAYGKAPPCFSALQEYRTLTSEGRMFSQYTPGWSLFMAPFLAIGVVWLAAPCSLGLLAVAVARLARRAAAGASGGRRDVTVAAGPIAALALVCSNTVLINGGSRFSHIFVGRRACFRVVGRGVVRDVGAERSHAQAPSVGVRVLGLASAWLVTTSPADGGTLGLGLLVYFVYAVADRRVAPGVPMLATGISFAIWGGLSLVLLRLQLGKWFTAGYSVTAQFHAGSRVSMSTFKLGELKWAIPLATGAYCWWPLCSGNRRLRPSRCCASARRAACVVRHARRQHCRPPRLLLVGRALGRRRLRLRSRGTSFLPSFPWRWEQGWLSRPCGLQRARACHLA